MVGWPADVVSRLKKRAAGASAPRGTESQPRHQCESKLTCARKMEKQWRGLAIIRRALNFPDLDLGF